MSRHRRRRQEHSATVAASAAMMAAVCERLAEDFKLNATDPRVEQASIYKANQLLWEQRIAAGEAIPSAELSSYSDVIVRLLGLPPPPVLKCSWVYTCFDCRREDDKPDPRVCCPECGEAKSERPRHTSAPVVEPAAISPARNFTTGDLDTTPDLPAAAAPKPRTREDDYRISEAIDHSIGHRKPLRPLDGNTIAEKAASLNARTPSPFGGRSSYSRFDNNG
jgi:hypothetical protein